MTGQPRGGKPHMGTKEIRETAAAYVRAQERAGETPSALIRWTIPGLCDEVDYLRKTLAVLLEPDTEPAYTPEVDAMVELLDNAWPRGGGRGAIVEALAHALVDAGVQIPKGD